MSYWPGKMKVYMIKMRRAFTRPRVMPTTRLTRSSFQMTLSRSPVSTSPRARPRTIRVLVWLPQLPAVSGLTA